jgi:hypothetical protein
MKSGLRVRPKEAFAKLMATGRAIHHQRQKALAMFGPREGNFPVVEEVHQKLDFLEAQHNRAHAAFTEIMKNRRELWGSTHLGKTHLGKKP